MHPSRLWCHCRQVYLPMAWLYGRRATVPEDALVRALRDELYAGKWASIDWDAAPRHGRGRRGVPPPTTVALRATNRALEAAERVVPARLRERGARRGLRHIVYEDRVTSFIDIGPVNKVLNAFVHHFDEPGRRAAFGAPSTRATTTSGTATTARRCRATTAASCGTRPSPCRPSSRRPPPARRRARACSRRPTATCATTRSSRTCPTPRATTGDPSRGGWPFSNRAHGWPITDCTAEGLKCALALEGRVASGIPEGLLRDAVRLMLVLAERGRRLGDLRAQRGGAWLELLEPVAGLRRHHGRLLLRRVHERVLQALVAARSGALARTWRRRSTARSSAARSSSARKQRPDGGFEGVVGGLLHVRRLVRRHRPPRGRRRPDDEAIVRACRLPARSTARRRGLGRGRRTRAASTATSRPTRGGVAQTVWALSTLVRARHPSARRPARGPCAS